MRKLIIMIAILLGFYFITQLRCDDIEQKVENVNHCLFDRHDGCHK